MLPSTGMVTLLDSVDGHLKAITVHSSEIKSNAHAGGNFARGLAYVGPHSTVELEGVTSSLSVRGGAPVFYIRLPSEDPDTVRNRATLLRLKPLKDTRQVLDFSQNVFGGGRKRKVDEVPVVKSDVDGGMWIKLTPRTPLAPGEYGITFMPKDALLFSDIVYDFTVPETK